MVEIDPDVSLTVFDYVELKEYIAALFDQLVDVVNRSTLKPLSDRRRRRMPSMPSDKVGGTLQDILHHIDLATSLLRGFDRTAFESDIRTIYAVTRCLEIISEASRRLPDELKARHLAIAWK
nr:HepT-like ribonuclease domain-containing protein [Bradyrhizobium sp. SZCCHNS1054]